jgi:outer membrane biogenesis lipoprotein LolB
MKAARFPILVLATGAVLLQACQTTETTEPDGTSLDREESFIPFANQRSSVTSWQANGREGLWIESGRGDWYYARFMAPCQGIDSAIRLGFDIGNSDRIDRFSYVIVPNERERCPIVSLKKSDPPPDGDRRKFD